MTPVITSRRRRMKALETTACRACGNPLLFVAPCTVVVLHVNGHTHTPRICRSCDLQDDKTLIAALADEARRSLATEDIFVTQYMKDMAEV